MLPDAASPALPAPRLVHRLPTGDGHVLHVAEFGPADGTPVALLHGGPGSGVGPVLLRPFAGTGWRVIAIDQRGAGQSSPRGATACNTLAHLLADLRVVRSALGIARWAVAGGSWGATLAVAHAADDPDGVAALLLRAPFLGRDSDAEAFFRPDGMAPPLRWRDFGTLRPAAQAEAALAWWRHEQARSHGEGPPPPQPHAPSGEALAMLIDRCRVMSHYLNAGCFLRDRPLLERAAALRPVPAWLLQGDADRVCPPAAAALLAAVLPWAHWRSVAGAGHDPAHPAMARAMAEALAALANASTHAVRRGPP